MKKNIDEKILMKQHQQLREEQKNLSLEIGFRKRKKKELEELIRSSERLQPNEKKAFGKDFDEFMQVIKEIKGGL